MGYRNPYRDCRALDGGLATGWRYVRKGGRVKFSGIYYVAPELAEIVGEFVHVAMNDYWMGEVIIQRGVIGCMGNAFKAFPED